MAKLFPYIFILINFIGLSQQTTFKISVNDSTIIIGQPFEVSTTITRPFESTLFCQDTNSNLYPFNFQSLQTFESILLNDSTIKDSAIYSLVSYKPYKIQHLKLLAGLRHQQDSFSLQSNNIHLNLNSYIDSVHTDMKPKAYTPFYEYEKKSYLDILEILGICLIILSIIFSFIFIKKLHKQKKIKQLRLAFYSLQTDHQSEEELYTFINNWKQFIEQSTNYKIASMTTPEIKHIIDNKRIIETLTEIDSIKYNPRYTFKNIDTDSLIEYANECLTSKIKELDEKS